VIDEKLEIERLDSRRIQEHYRRSEICAGNNCSEGSNSPVSSSLEMQVVQLEREVRVHKLDVGHSQSL
jgi:hypothetical protein